MALLSPNLDWSLANKLWSQAINPFLSNPVNEMSIIKNVQLNNGSTQVNHSLGKTMQGWVLLDIQGPAIIYRSAPLNAKTLTLTSSAAVTVTLGVF